MHFKRVNLMVCEFISMTGEKKVYVYIRNKGDDMNRVRPVATINVNKMRYST